MIEMDVHMTMHDLCIIFEWNTTIVIELNASRFVVLENNGLVLFRKISLIFISFLVREPLNERSNSAE